MRRYLPLLALSFGLIPHWAQRLELPTKPGSFRFAVIGDSGTGGKGQLQVAGQMVTYRTLFPFEAVLMLGDNLYGGDRPTDYEKKFKRPYKSLLDSGVKFFAALGNHDNPNQRFYAPFNMEGQRYYTFSPHTGVQCFALDSSYMDEPQLKWLNKQLSSSAAEWKICFLHHPIYSSGARHGSNLGLRRVLEPLFLKHGVDVVFSGHEHFYERLKPQSGIYYFTSGAAGRLRRGNIRKTKESAKGFDQDLSFMLVEIAGDELHFQVISRTGNTVDLGTIQKTSSKVIDGPKAKVHVLH